MTDEERTALKAEIIAEFGQHLDDHYTKTIDMKTGAIELVGSISKEIAQPIAKLISDLDDRISDVEFTVALTDAHRGVDPTDGPWWIWVANVKSKYAKHVRGRVAKWLSESEGRLGDEDLGEDGRARILRLAKLLKGKD